MTFFLAGLFGLVVGSFLNVVIHRVPRKESVVRPASHCPECGARIKPRDNIPLLSYLMLGGRCRSCETRIPIRYPVVEAATGVLFGSAAYRFGPGLELASAMVLISVLVALAGIDLEHLLLPNAVLFPATLAGLVFSVLLDPGRWWIYPVSGFLLAASLFALAVIYPGGMGMGDVKMSGMLGIFLGPYAALAVFLGALGGALAGGLLMLAGRIGRRSHLPFGVFMSAGGVSVLFFGPWLWQTYARAVGGI